MRTQSINLGLALLLSSHLSAQHQEVNEQPTLYKGKNNQTEDTTSLLHAFKHGQYSGHFRYFFMATDNAEGLSDYFANAIGGGLHYNTARFHGFQFGLSGFYVFNLYSSDLGGTDPLTGMGNRYEIGLFDLENPYNHKDIDRLEELYVKYSYKGTSVTAGRQLINTPFINLQDGRMRPTGVEGFWLESQLHKKLKLEGGWIYAISPRSTTKWFSIEESIGLYPSGVNPDGSKSNYFEHLESKGVALVGIKYQPLQWLTIQAWDVYTENIFNSALFQIDAERKKDRNSLYAGFQFIRQDAVNHGGNEDQSKAYIHRGASASTFGGRIGLKLEKFDVSLNYTNITGEGRYLFPREWGRDPFYTFMPRERNEGAGGSQAYVLKVTHSFPKAHVKTSLAAGYVQMPDVENTALNKYGMPSYGQLNFDVRYSFNKIFKGLEAQFLVVGKTGIGDTHGNHRFVFNKVNMVLYNFMLNYHF